MVDEFTRNSHRTAIARTEISSPLRHIINIKPELRNVLHQGPGRPDNPDREMVKDLATGRVIEYDPGHGPTRRGVLRKSNCDQAISIYVLNVLPPSTRKFALLDLYRSLKPGGIAYIAVRSAADIEKNCNGWKKCRDGYIVERGKHKNFQKGYTKQSLRRELLEHFKTVEVFDQGGFILAVAQREL